MICVDDDARFAVCALSGHVGRGNAFTTRVAEALSAQAAWSDARLADITASSSWRLTGPIRRAKAILRQARDRGRG